MHAFPLKRYMGTKGEYLFVNNIRVHGGTTYVAAEFDGEMYYNS